MRQVLEKVFRWIFGLGFKVGFKWVAVLFLVGGLYGVGTPTVEAGYEVDCVADGLAAYMIDVLKHAGELDRIKFLTPAFNMTESQFTSLLGAVVTRVNIPSGAGTTYWDEIDFIAGNAYNTYWEPELNWDVTNGDGGRITEWLARARATASDKPYFLTEVGWHEFVDTDNGMYPVTEQDAVYHLTTEIGALETDSEIGGAALFNAYNNNGGWSQFSMVKSGNAKTDKLIDVACGGDDCFSEILSGCGAGGCSKIGVNTASGLGGASVYNAVADQGLKYVVGIVTSSDNVGGDVVGALSNGVTPVIRIGVQQDSGGFYQDGLNPAAAYVALLQHLNAVIKTPEILDADGYVYAIVGPNEPDAEHWAAPNCTYTKGDDGADGQLRSAITISGKVTSTLLSVTPSGEASDAALPVENAVIATSTGEKLYGNLVLERNELGEIKTVISDSDGEFTLTFAQGSGTKRYLAIVCGEAGGVVLDQLGVLEAGGSGDLPLYTNCNNKLNASDAVSALNGLPEGQLNYLIRERFLACGTRGIDDAADRVLEATDEGTDPLIVGSRTIVGSVQTTRLEDTTYTDKEPTSLTPPPSIPTSETNYGKANLMQSGEDLDRLVTASHLITGGTLGWKEYYREEGDELTLPSCERLKACKDPIEGLEGSLGLPGLNQKSCGGIFANLMTPFDPKVSEVYYKVKDELAGIAVCKQAGESITFCEIAPPEWILAGGNTGCDIKLSSEYWHPSLLSTNFQPIQPVLEGADDEFIVEVVTDAVVPIEKAPRHMLGPDINLSDLVDCAAQDASKTLSITGAVNETTRKNTQAFRGSEQPVQTPAAGRPQTKDNADLSLKTGMTPEVPHTDRVKRSQVKYSMVGTDTLCSCARFGEAWDPTTGKCVAPSNLFGKVTGFEPFDDIAKNLHKTAIGWKQATSRNPNLTWWNQTSLVESIFSWTCELPLVGLLCGYIYNPAADPADSSFSSMENMRAGWVRDWAPPDRPPNPYTLWPLPPTLVEMLDGVNLFENRWEDDSVSQESLADVQAGATQPGGGYLTYDPGLCGPPDTRCDSGCDGDGNTPDETNITDASSCSCDSGENPVCACDAIRTPDCRKYTAVECFNYEAQYRGGGTSSWTLDDPNDLICGDDCRTNYDCAEHGESGNDPISCSTVTQDADCSVCKNGDCDECACGVSSSGTKYISTDTSVWNWSTTNASYCPTLDSIDLANCWGKSCLEGHNPCEDVGTGRCHYDFGGTEYECRLERVLPNWHNYSTQRNQKKFTYIATAWVEPPTLQARLTIPKYVEEATTQTSAYFAHMFGQPGVPPPDVGESLCTYDMTSAMQRNPGEGYGQTEASCGKSATLDTAGLKAMIKTPSLGNERTVGGGIIGRGIPVGGYYAMPGIPLDPAPGIPFTPVDITLTNCKLNGIGPGETALVYGDETLPVPAKMRAILESAGSAYNVPAPLLLGLLRAEGAFGAYDFTDQNIDDWSRQGGVVPGCIEEGGHNESSTGAEGPYQWVPRWFESFQYASQIHYSGRTPHICNFLDQTYAAAKKLSQENGGTSSYTNRHCASDPDLISCYNCIPLNLGSGRAAACNQWDESDISTAARQYLGYCGTDDADWHQGTIFEVYNAAATPLD